MYILIFLIYAFTYLRFKAHYLQAGGFAEHEGNMIMANRHH